MTAVYEMYLAELRKQVNHKSADLSKIKVVTSTILDIASKQASFQIKIHDLRERLLVASKKLEKEGSVGTKVKQFPSDLQTLLLASRKESEG